MFAIAVQSDGKIVVGGLFNGANSIGGQTRNFIARLDATTGAADSFDPNANSYVSALLVQPNDKIVVGGDFSGANSIGGQTRNRMARLDPTTGLADSFDPNANSTVLSIAQEADSKIIVGGDFSGPNSIGGLTRNFIARLDPVTGAADSFDPNASSVVFAVAVQPDGKILVGGTFTTIGGQTRNHMARLNQSTGQADSFDPSASGTVFAIAVQQDNKVLVGGDFAAASPVGGAVVTRNHVARLEKDGRLDQTLDLGIVTAGLGFFSAVAVQPDGKILLGGNYHEVPHYFVRLNADGTRDSAFNATIGGASPSCLAVQQDGKILIAGSITSIDGQPRHNIGRVDGATGAVDSFDPNANNTTWLIAPQRDGKILAGGFFSSIGGQARVHVARLDGETGLADSFDPNLPTIGNTLSAIVVQRDGKIVVGGAFAENGGTYKDLLRLDPVTGLPDSLNPDFDRPFINALTVEPNGKIVVATDSRAIDGQPRLNGVARLDPTTGFPDNFGTVPNLTTDGYVISMVELANGNIFVGGGFNTIGGQTRHNVARLDGGTGAADSFDPNITTTNDLPSEMDGMAVQADGKLLVAGHFDTVGGRHRQFFARLSNNVAALQKLTVTQSTATWTLGGSSPQFTRVIFEYSSDNGNYTSLGEGTPVDNSWILMNQNFPTGQNFYVRARGFYRCGFRNGSESIIESVRNAFFPFAPIRVVSRKIHGNAGAFDIDLPLSGTPGVECRSGGATGDYQMIFTFASAVTFNNAVISGGAGSIGSVSGSGTSAVTVDLTGVANAQTITVSLLGTSNGTSSSDFSVSMSVLVGDTSSNGTVNASDLTKTKGQVGVTLSDRNFREDVNASGSINATDIGIVKAQSGTALPNGNRAVTLLLR